MIDSERTKPSNPAYRGPAAMLFAFSIVTSPACSMQQAASPDARVDTTAQPIDPEPELACTDTCHGGCGPNCTYCPKTYNSSCLQDQYGQNTGYQQTVETDSCGTHTACRLHDDCLLACANNSGTCNWSPTTACALTCHAEVVAIWGWFFAGLWAVGLGPTDGTLVFNYPQAPVLNTQACPLPVSGGGGEGGGGGGGDDDGGCFDNGWGCFSSFDCCSGQCSDGVCTSVYEQ
jgi:hypothetical protein